MKQFKKWIPHILLGVITFFFCWMFVGRYGVFGSKVDWLNQHSVIPDYFRQQFYDTGELFPEFAMNLGGGQNIYNFSYYGLYSPVILFSYLLPFIKMSDYIIATSMISLAVSVMIFYRWLLKHGVSKNISFMTALYFLLAAPMIFHSYGHIMFVNYMPFLCLAFCGVDVYFEKKKIGLYTISVFLMIMTSFYFSIGGMLALVLYGVYRYLQVKETGVRKIKIVEFIVDGIHFLLPMMAAVMMCGVLLIPTAMALVGRGGGKASVSLASLLIPDIHILRFVYNPYGIGLTTLVGTVLITGLFYRKWSERVLNLGCVIILTVPVFAYLLNGGLYVRDKVMIPFLPLLCYLTACYLEKLKRREISFGVGFFPFLVTIVLLYMGRGQKDYEKYWKFLILDGIIMTVCFLVFWWKRYTTILILFPIVFLILYGNEFHQSADRIVEREFYNHVTDQKLESVVEMIVSDDDEFYRMEQLGMDAENGANINRIHDMGQYVSSVYSSSYNADYQKFRKDIFQLEQPFRNILMQSAVSNPVFQKFMGVKYLISEHKLPGYKLYKTIGDINVYKNEDVSPIAYATNQVMSEKEYLELDFPDNQMALLNATVAKEGKLEKDFVSSVPEVKLSKIEYHMNGGKSKSVHIPIPEATDSDILFLQFDIENNNPTKDVSVWLEGIKNKLTAENHIYYNENTTFHYAVALEKGQKEVSLKFGKGNYVISNMRCYIGTQSQENELYQSEFQPDKAKTKGNKIAGTIDVANTGYFITTIPYDSAFEVKVDGEIVENEKINTAFLGMKIEKGFHEIEIIYHAPGVKAGKLVSLVGIILFIVLKKMYRR